jgi:hypothetical protein
VKWRFFTLKDGIDQQVRQIWWGNILIVLACPINDKKGGHIFLLNGKSYNNFPNPYYNIEQGKSVGKEITFNQAVNLFDAQGRKNFLAFFPEKINLKPQRLSKNKIKEIISLLEKARAFDGDRAYQGTNDNFYYLDKMEEKKLIIESPIADDMFYLSPNYKELLNNRESLDKNEKV